jgi:hypothetical protein
MKISSWMVGLALISGISIGMSLFFYNFANEYGVTDVNNLSSFNRLDELNSTIGETATRLNEQQGLIERIFTTAGLLWGVFTQMITLPLMFLGFVDDTSNVLSPVGGLPIWFTTMVGVIITIVLIMKIAGILANRDEI